MTKKSNGNPGSIKGKVCPVCKIRTNIARHRCPEVECLTEGDVALWRYWKAKKVKKEHAFHLSFVQLKQKADEAGITGLDIGRTGYHLSRLNDTGPYDMTSRFLTASENMKERNTHGGRSKEVCAKMRKAKEEKCP